MPSFWQAYSTPVLDDCAVRPAIRERRVYMWAAAILDSPHHDPSAPLRLVAVSADVEVKWRLSVVDSGCVIRFSAVRGVTACCRVRLVASAVLVASCAAVMAIAARPAAASSTSANATAIHQVLVRFAKAAYSDDAKQMCALATPAAGQDLVSSAGFSGSRTVSCRGNLGGLFRLFRTSGPVHPLSQIVASWSRAPVRVTGDTARATVLRLASGPPFPKGPATMELALLQHNGSWLLATDCKAILVCNRLPAPGDIAAIQAVVMPWQLAATGHGNASASQLCSLLAPALRKAAGGSRCAAALRSSLAMAKRKPVPWPRVKRDLAAIVIQNAGINANVQQSGDLDFGGSPDWIVVWTHGRWLLDSMDG